MVVGLGFLVREEVVQVTDIRLVERGCRKSPHAATIRLLFLHGDQMHGG
jgi:hypothetical protein